MKKFFSIILKCSIAITFICVIPFASTAQFSSISNEALVNTTTAGEQWGYWWSLRTAAVQPDGSFIIVWIDNNGLDGSGQGIFGQRFNNSGAKLGGQFQVNTTITGDQFSPSISVAPDGSFIVAWEGPGSSIDVFAQRFTNTGVKVRSEFLLNTTVSGSQRYPEMQFYPDGTWVAAYVEASGGQTVIQRFDTDDRTIGLETRISSAAGDVVLDGLCVRPDNSVLLFWTSADDVYGQIFDTNIQPIGTATRLNTYTAGTQEYAVARVDGEGNFVAGWESDGQDGSGMGVYARRFDKNFNPLGAEFAVTTNTTNDQHEPQIAMEPGGRFFIVWSDLNNRDGGGAAGSWDGASIWMREFTANGTPVGSETMVNQSTSGYQAYPVVDINASGRLVISWEGNGTLPGQIDNYGIFSRSYQFSQTGTNAITVTPLTTIAGDTVTVTMTLTAPSNISNVMPNPLSLLGTNGAFANLISGPTPASATVGAAPVSYIWKYKVTADETTGSLNFAGNARSNGIAIFPYAASSTISIKPSILINDITGPNLVDDSNNPISGPKAFTIGAKITNPSLDTLNNIIIYLGNGVTAGTFPVTNMTLAQTNNTYQGSFALTPLAGTGDCTRSITKLGPAKNIIAGQIDFDGNAVINISDSGLLSNGRRVVNGRVDVTGNGIVNNSDDLPRPPGVFSGYREPSIIDGYVDANNDGIINASDIGTYGGETRNIYWQVSYAVKDAGNIPTFGDCNDLGDDLRYKWSIWGTCSEEGFTRTDIVKDYAKVRCMISAAANKIMPTGNPKGYVTGSSPHIIGGMVDIIGNNAIESDDDGTYFGKPVINGLLDMNNSGTITTADDGLINSFVVIDGYIDVDNNGIINAADDGILVQPGMTFSVTFHNVTFGNVGAGFDEDRDNLSDYDFWHQPVGETTWPSASFRLIDIKTDVTGKGAGNPLNNVTTHYNNDPYLSRIIGDNAGTFDADYTYTFEVIADGTGLLAPYQEAASGADNVKYNGDYGAGVTIYTKRFIPLPVTGLEITARLKNNTTAIVEWSTMSEINLSHFVVERSTDGNNFTEAGLVFANGNTTVKTYYNFSDNLTNVQSGIIYYRVRSVDIDGKAQYSAIRIIRMGGQDEVIKIITYPNPVTNKLQITIPASWQNKKVIYELYNGNGQVAEKIEVAGSSQTETMNVSKLSKGFYIVRVSCEGKAAQQKITKQ